MKKGFLFAATSPVCRVTHLKELLEGLAADQVRLLSHKVEQVLRAVLPFLDDIFVESP